MNNFLFLETRTSPWWIVTAFWKLGLKFTFQRRLTCFRVAEIYRLFITVSKSLIFKRKELLNTRTRNTIRFILTYFVEISLFSKITRALNWIILDTMDWSIWELCNISCTIPIQPICKNKNEIFDSVQSTPHWIDHIIT